MLRRVFTTLAALSMLLCVATCVLWVRSRTFHESLHAGNKSGSLWMLSSRGEGLRLARVLSWPTTEKFTFTRYRRGSMPSLIALDGIRTVHWERLGVSVHYGTATTRLDMFSPDTLVLTGDRNPFYDTSLPMRYWAATVPHWQIAILFGLLPSLIVAVYVGRKLRTHHREKRRLCPKCGYDLRATPNRCPECATVRKMTS